MKILSLFDGISCGAVALKRAGVAIERYDAFEIDKYAVAISKHNHPEIIHHGDVLTADWNAFKGYDLLIGGSPCQKFSIANKDRERSLDGGGGELFKAYLQALAIIRPRFFLFENVASMHKEVRRAIDDEFKKIMPDAYCIEINSALVSAQQRKRLYWTNIPNVKQPDDRGILLKDILETGVPWTGKSYCLTARYNGTTLKHTLEKGMGTMVAEQIGGALRTRENGKQLELKRDGKSNSLTTVQTDTVVAMKVPEATKKGYCEIQPGECVDLTQINSKTRRGRKMAEKSNCLTAQNQLYQYLKPIKVGLAQNENGTTPKDSQGNRVYSVEGKSVTLNSGSGGKGGKCGLYKIDLPDGEYLIRKLTPIECERLQGLPDDYSSADGTISNSQRYKCLGNAWQVDTIAHILQGVAQC